MILSDTSDLLRARGQYEVSARHLPMSRIVTFAALGSGVFGAALGSFAGRPEQMLYSACKVPLLLLVSTILCIPSFYVVNAILGIAGDFRVALRSIIAAQGALGLALAAISPFVPYLYISGIGYNQAKLASGLLFAVASLASQWMLRKHYSRLLTRSSRHRLGRRFWAIIYIFVAIQMAWVLRPYLGNPNLESQFFRENAWSNAYVEILRMMRKAAGL